MLLRLSFSESNDLTRLLHTFTALFSSIDTMSRWSPPPRWTPSGLIALVKQKEMYKRGLLLSRKQIRVNYDFTVL